LTISAFIFASQNIDSNALITYGYFKKQIDSLTSYIDSKIKSLDDKINKLGSSQSTSNGDFTKLEEDLRKTNSELNQLKDRVSLLEKRISNISSGNQNQTKKDYVVTKGYEVIKVAKGKTIIFDSSSEFILRTGKALSIVPKSASIIDLSTSKDISNAQSIPANHLLLVIRDDGRGFKAIEDVWVIVNGGYKIR